MREAKASRAAPGEPEPRDQGIASAREALSNAALRDRKLGAGQEGGEGRTRLIRRALLRGLGSSIRSGRGGGECVRRLRAE